MASDPLRDQLLAKYGPVSDSPSGGLADQIAALQGLRPSESKDEGWDIFQPVRTFFGATGGVGGQVAGAFAPEAYQKALEEIRAARGVTDESPWYEQTEASPTAGDVAVASMSPEFRQSGLGHFVEPVTRLAGGILGDPTTYLGFGAGKLASSIAGRVAPELVGAASTAERARAAAIAAGTLTADAAKTARFNDAAQIAERVLSAGSPMQQRLFRAGGWVQQAEPVALAAPAALAYGPETIRSIYEQAKQIPQSEHPVADAASVALLSGMTVLMGKGLMDAGRAINTWRTHAETHSLTPDVIAQGEAQITAKVQELSVPEMPVVEGSFAYDPYVERPGVTRVADAGVPSAEPIPGAPVRVGEAGIPTAEPVTGVTRVATAGEPQLLDPSAVSLEPLPVLPEGDARLARGRPPQNIVEGVAEPPVPAEVKVAAEPQVATSIPPVTPELPPVAPELPPVAAAVDPMGALSARVKEANLSELETKILQRKFKTAGSVEEANAALDSTLADRARRAAPAPPAPDLQAQLEASLTAKVEPASTQQAAESAPPIKPERKSVV